MIDERTGRRYETCALCGVVWNVAIVAEVPEDGYLCPTCRLKERLRTIPQSARER